jgi:hypothetical protein
MYKGIYKEKKIIYEKLENLMKIQIRLMFFKAVLQFLFKLSSSLGVTISQIYILFTVFFNMVKFNDNVYQILLNSFDNIKQSFEVMMNFISLVINFLIHLLKFQLIFFREQIFHFMQDILTELVSYLKILNY